MWEVEEEENLMRKELSSCSISSINLQNLFLLHGQAAMFFEQWGLLLMVTIKLSDVTP